MALSVASVPELVKRTASIEGMRFAQESGEAYLGLDGVAEGVAGGHRPLHRLDHVRVGVAQYQARCVVAEVEVLVTVDIVDVVALASCGVDRVRIEVVGRPRRAARQVLDSLFVEPPRPRSPGDVLLNLSLHAVLSHLPHSAANGSGQCVEWYSTWVVDSSGLSGGGRRSRRWGRLDWEPHAAYTRR